MPTQANDEGSPSTKGEVTPAVSTSDDVIGPEMTAIENVVKHLRLDSWQVDNTQQVNCTVNHVAWKFGNPIPMCYLLYVSSCDHPN